VLECVLVAAMLVDNMVEQLMISFRRKNIVIRHVLIRELDRRNDNQDGHIHTVKNLVHQFVAHRFHQGLC
ncbi:hypothetical protein LOAG_15816, partial [Loa loa]